MSFSGSINTHNCFEWYTFGNNDRSFAPSPRRALERSSSSSAVPTRLNPSTSGRSQSASPAPSKRSYFSLSSRFERRRSEPQATCVISAPVLISSTNPLVTVQQEITANVTPSHESTDCESLCNSSFAEIDEILESFEDEEDDEDDEPTQEDMRYMTSLSPPPARLNNSPSRLSKRIPRQSQTSITEIQTHHPQPRSHFSICSEANSEYGSCGTSRCSNQTESAFSRGPRRESDASFFTSTLPAGEWFDYNPYFSKISERGGFATTPTILADEEQISGLEVYLSEVGLM